MMHSPFDIAKGYLAEYKSLRQEIIKRIELRQQVVQIMLAFAGVFFGFGITKPGVAFLIAPISALLAYSWAQNDKRIFELGTHIAELIEVNVEGLSWERRLLTKRMDSRDSPWRRTVYSQGGSFLIIQLIGVGMGLMNFTFSFVEATLLVVALYSLYKTYYVLKDVSKR